MLTVRPQLKVSPRVKQRLSLKQNRMLIGNIMVFSLLRLIAVEGICPD